MIKRTEEWQIEVEWGISTLVVEVQDDEAILVAEAMLEEFGFTKNDGIEDVDPGRQRFVMRIPYARAAERLGELGFKRVDNAEKVS